jgi:hypothetical protein
MSHARVLPLEVKVTHEAGDEHQIAIISANDRVCDVNLVALRVPNGCRLHHSPKATEAKDSKGEADPGRSFLAPFGKRKLAAREEGTCDRDPCTGNPSESCSTPSARRLGDEASTPCAEPERTAESTASGERDGADADSRAGSLRTGRSRQENGRSPLGSRASRTDRRLCAVRWSSIAERYVRRSRDMLFANIGQLSLVVDGFGFWS